MMRLKRILIAAGMAGMLAAPASSAQAQTASCQFILGFKTLHDMIPQIVGNCIDNQAFAANGDAQQHTTGASGAGGLLVWRKADNWTAYTDGYRTWINGPNGLVNRLNSGPLFPWENPTPPAPPPPPAPTATPTPSYAFLAKHVTDPPRDCGQSYGDPNYVPCDDSDPNAGTQKVYGHIMDKNGNAISGIIVQAQAYGNTYNSNASDSNGRWEFDISTTCPIEHRVYNLYVVDGQGHQSSNMWTVTYDNCNTAGEFHVDFVRQS